MKSCPLLIWIVACCVAAAPSVVGPARAQWPKGVKRVARERLMPENFTFVRVRYHSPGGMNAGYYYFEGRRWERWETDYPEAEWNLMIRLRELTTLRINPEPIALRLTDAAIYDYPFMYMCDVGWMELKEEERGALREYLMRGGFVWADDFWGDGEWNNFEYEMARVFPELEWRPIPSDHPILRIVFQLDACPQVPARSFAYPGGPTYDARSSHRRPLGSFEHVNFVGLHDEEGRLMMVATHNSDIGDGWEREAGDEWYFENFSVKAYAMAINIITYALTH